MWAIVLRLVIWKAEYASWKLKKLLLTTKAAGPTEFFNCLQNNEQISVGLVYEELWNVFQISLT